MLSSPLVFFKVSLFSLNGKTFYLNITQPNVVRIYLDETAIDLKSAPQVPDNVVICGGRGADSLADDRPPFSVQELKDLVAECMTAPTPPPLPVQPLFE